MLLKKNTGSSVKWLTDWLWRHMAAEKGLGKREKEYIERHQTSSLLYSRARELFARGVTHDSRYFEPMPIYCARAKGSRKWDVDGNEYIDYWMGHGALILGHANPTVTRAAVEQAHKGTHLGASHELEIQWAEKVTQLVPSARGGLVEFTSSGTEATMMSFRITRAYTGRTKIIKFISHFHGWLDYPIVDYNPDYSPPLAGSFPPGVPLGTCQSIVALPPNDIAAVEKTIEKGDVAAVILEPGGAMMGYIPSNRNFLNELRKITERNGVILIFDEVVTGFRDAPGGAQEYYGVTPDLSTLGKILAGGYPGGAVAGKKEYMEMLDFKKGDKPRPSRISHPGTFNANPLSAAAGNACLGIVSQGKIHPRISRMGEVLKSGLNDAISDNGLDGLAWGATSSIVYFGFGISEDDLEVSNIEGFVRLQGKKNASQRLTKHLEKALINRGVHPMGPRMILSIAHTKADIQTTIEKFDESLKELKEEGLFKKPMA